MGAVNLVLQTVLAPGADLRNSQTPFGTVLKVEHEVGKVVPADFHIFIKLFCRAQLPGKGFYFANRPLAHRDAGSQICHHFGDFQPGDEHHHVHPVRADIRHAAQRAALFGQQPPVPIGGQQQPVLQVRAVDGMDLAQFAPLYQCTGFMVDRIVPQVIVHCAGQVFGFCQLHQGSRFFRGHRERFFTNNMLPCFKRFHRMAVVQIVR